MMVGIPNQPIPVKDLMESKEIDEGNVKPLTSLPGGHPVGDFSSLQHSVPYYTSKPTGSL